ncbi:MAG: hypothetical protein H6742_19845 [Alphaproteobacteria bacterium]|nr:hypothetical protein [Alphaproteobacteria bacterium]
MASPSRITDDRRLALGLGLLTLGALGIRLWLVAWDRLLVPATPGGAFPPLSVFDGHERGYVRAFLGQAPDPSMQAVPALTAAWGLLGRVTDDVRVLVGLCCLMGALCVPLVGRWAAHRFGTAAGLWAAACLALLPEHAAWSTSAYTVIPAQLLLVAGLTAQDKRVATLWLSLAACVRPEVALFGLARGWAGLFPLGVGLFWLSRLAAPHLGDPVVAVMVNLPMVAFIGPPVLLVGLLSLLPGDTARKAWPLLAFVLAVHVGTAAFFDQGPRHELIGGAAACVLVGAAAVRWKHVPGVIAVAGLALSLVQLKGIVHSPRPVPPAAEGRLDRGAVPAGCVEVSDEPPIPDQPIPSHVLVGRGIPHGDCMLWGEDPQHGAWSSRGLRPRALRMHTLYRLTVEAERIDGIRLYRLEPRWPWVWGEGPE